MAVKRLAIFDPSGRLAVDVEPLASEVGVAIQKVNLREAMDLPHSGAAAMLVAPGVASELGPVPDHAPPRWVVGDANNPARVAGAAAGSGASGVLLTPVSVEAIDAIAHNDPTSPEIDLARSRGLIATSLIDLAGDAVETLRAVADGFTAHDCIVWWRDGNQMLPTAARPSPTDSYRTQIASAARIAAAAAGTVICSGPKPRSVIAEPLRASQTEVAGLVAIVSDSGRRFSGAERTDLKAIAARLTRELSWLASHRRLVAEGERLLASSMHDPLTGAMTRGAFEQTVAHEVAAASRRNERTTLAVIDLVGMRKINLQHGHKSGDEVLAQLAARVRATVRGNDPIGRLGGDELAVLLIAANDEQAHVVGKKLLQKIQGEPVKIIEETAGPNGEPRTTLLDIQIRFVVTEIASGERSGEAAVARIYASLRTAPIGEVCVVDPAERVDSTTTTDGGLSAGTVLGGSYRVVHELSRGAMGVVYRGEDLGLGRSVAIKVLRSDLASDRDLVARFRAEAGILASLHHPNLVQVFALGEHQGEVYFVMELVEGQPLSEVLRQTIEREEWFPTEAISQIALEIGDALDAMHAAGLIHRDVKPANILLDRERDRAVLVDVGVAVKQGDQRDAAGTPGFAAPESFLEQEGTAQTDVYGLAATVYSMLAGRPPFGSGPAPQVVQRQLHDPLVPPSRLRPGLGEGVDAVIAKALAPTPKKRWASASTFAVALKRALERSSGDTTPPPQMVSKRAATDPIVAEVQSLLVPTTGITNDDLSIPGSQRGMYIGKNGRVRAAHLRVLSRILRHNIGESGMAKIASDFPALASALAPTLAPLAWVSLGDLVSIFAKVKLIVHNPLVPRKVGRGTMSATFPRLFGAEPTSLPVETVLSAMPTFWARYHDWGDVNIDIHPGGGSADVILHGHPGSTDICAMVGAELERIVELTGASAVGAAHVECLCQGGTRCQYRLSWTT